MKQDCEDIITLLESSTPSEWAELFIELKLLFYRKHCLGLIFSTVHGIEFFNNIIKCMNGEQWTPDGEYEDNFRKFITHHKIMKKDTIDDIQLNPDYLSECCKSPIDGPITEGFGICSQCREYSEARPSPEHKERLFKEGLNGIHGRYPKKIDAVK